MKDRIICLVGESGCGKTTITEILRREGYNVIDSYTTREPRKKDEQGHTFMTREEIIKQRCIEQGLHPTATMDNIIKYSLYNDKDVIAYTYFDNNHLWAIREQYKGKGDSIYIIDPKGVEELLERNKDIDILVIYIKTDSKERYYRMLAERGFQDANKRIKHDREAFSIVKADYIVDGNRNIDEVLHNIEKIINL